MPQDRLAAKVNLCNAAQLSRWDSCCCLLCPMVPVFKKQAALRFGTMYPYRSYHGERAAMPSLPPVVVDEELQQLRAQVRLCYASLRCDAGSSQIICSSFGATEACARSLRL